MTTKKTTVRRPFAWDYLSSLEFLKEFDSWSQLHTRGYSRRGLAKRSGIASHNFMTLILSGQRPLTPHWLQGLAIGARLEPTEVTYLNLLINLEATTETVEREKLVDAIFNLLSSLESHSLSLDRLSLLRHPVALTVLRMLDLAGQDGTARWFKSHMRMKTSIPEINDALALLFRLNLIEQSPSGRLVAREIHLESPNQIKSAENAHFHKHVLSESLQIIETMEPAERSFGSLTVTVDARDTEQFKSEVHRFGKMMMKKYGKPAPVNGALYRLNIQLYPLTFTEPTP